MDKLIAENKKTYHDYEILEKYEAGIVLYGFEVKAVRNGNISLKGAYVTFYNNEAYLTGSFIGKYKPAGGLSDYEPERGRKLLLKKREILYLKGKSEVKGLTILPLSVYTKGSKVKIEIGIGKGKKQYEKKEKIKKRDIEREVRRTLKKL
ncbi:SsrA-binding protein SmpB [Candidatus Parcubacteria bacterium]|nr:SsrA-binding protein SmpB [Patescibacteria group bacterium]MCG2694073.1 SsrA-binding protein SmpB [Candidatus Parcubacteria bacterium]